jgi:hypothetical protein
MSLLIPILIILLVAVNYALPHNTTINYLLVTFGWLMAGFLTFCICAGCVGISG